MKKKRWFRDKIMFIKRFLILKHNKIPRNIVNIQGSFDQIEDIFPLNYRFLLC